VGVIGILLPPPRPAAGRYCARAADVPGGAVCVPTAYALASQSQERVRTSRCDRVAGLSWVHQSTRPPGFSWPDLRRAEGDPRPTGSLVAVFAFGPLLGWVALGTVFDLHQVILTSGVLVIATVASCWLTVPAALGLGVIGSLSFNGIVQDTPG